MIKKRKKTKGFYAIWEKCIPTPIFANSLWQECFLSLDLCFQNLPEILVTQFALVGTGLLQFSFQDPVPTPTPASRNIKVWEKNRREVTSPYLFVSLLGFQLTTGNGLHSFNLCWVGPWCCLIILFLFQQM